MHTPAQTSPFAALTLKEQQEKWIVWQSQHNDTPAFSAKEAALPPLRLPRVQAAEAPHKEPAAAVNTPSTPKAEPLPPLRHSQYDAVLKRMDIAGRRAGPWQSIT